MPGVYTLESREERLSSIIRRSGGLLYTANIRGAKLIRQKKDVVDTLEVNRLLKSLNRDTARVKDSSLQRTTRPVAIDLAFILNKPGSSDDITLEEGDELVIPRINNTISIYGEVFKPVDIMYERGKSMKDYLSDAGGVTQLGKRNKAFVIYANGSAAKIQRKLGIFPSYPKIFPGSSIYVPQKPKRDGQFDAGKAGILVSAITALITAAALFTR
jgi:protein involved in polysaccharide export with SLBB domain